MLIWVDLELRSRYRAGAVLNGGHRVGQTRTRGDNIRVNCYCRKLCLFVEWDFVDAIADSHAGDDFVVWRMFHVKFVWLYSCMFVRIVCITSLQLINFP